MKIAYVSTYLPQRCGVATYLDYLVQGIKEVDCGVEIKIIAERGAAPLKRDRFEVIPCWHRDENYVEPIIDYAKGMDVVHIQHEYSIYKFDDRLPSVLRRLDQTLKKVVTIHCIRPSQFCERGNDELYAKKIAELADCVIVHLESQREMLIRLGISPGKIHVIPHGTEIMDVDAEAARKKLGLLGQGRILLMFGFVKPHKCAHVALEALKEICVEEDAYLFIAGGLAPGASQREKRYVDLLKSKSRELGVEKRLLLPLKFFPDEDIPYLFGACDVVLFPYYEQDRSSSGAFHLAIGSGKPVIASRIPKFEELRNVCDELLVTPYNSHEIAKIAIRLFKDRTFAAHVQERLRKYREETSWKAIARKHLTLYDQLKQHPQTRKNVLHRNASTDS